MHFMISVFIDYLSNSILDCYTLFSLLEFYLFTETRPHVGASSHGAVTTSRTRPGNRNPTILAQEQNKSFSGVGIWADQFFLTSDLKERCASRTSTIKSSNRRAFPATGSSKELRNYGARKTKDAER